MSQGFVYSSEVLEVSRRESVSFSLNLAIVLIHLRWKYFPFFQEKKIEKLDYQIKQAFLRTAVCIAGLIVLVLKSSD